MVLVLGQEPVRSCEWCGGAMPVSARPDARYCRDSHRTAAWKAARADPLDVKRRRDREAIAARRARGVVESDRRVSYRRALAALTAHFHGEMGMLEDVAAARAVRVLGPAVPERLRP